MLRIIQSMMCLSIVLAILVPAKAVAQICTNPSGNIGDLIYNDNFDVFQGCTASSDWVALHEPQCADGSGCDPCDPANSPTPGTTCKDGSIYAGMSPDGNVPMYTTFDTTAGHPQIPT